MSRSFSKYTDPGRSNESVSVVAKMFSPSRSTIREANDHLQALYTKVNELEHTIKEQAESMINKDVQMQNKLKEVASGKDKEINELRRTLESSEAHMQRMLATNREKDALIAHLQQRCQVLDELCLSKPILEKLVAAMTKAESLKSVTNTHREERTLPRQHPQYINSDASGNQPLTNNTIARNFSISEQDDGEVDPSEDGGLS